MEVEEEWMGRRQVVGGRWEERREGKRQWLYKTNKKMLFK